MAILEKEVWTGISGNNKYYENLGYKIPKIKNSRGKMIIEKGTKILVKIEHLPESSNIKVTKICDDCEIKSPNILYNQIIKSRKKSDGKDRCYKCASMIGGLTQKNNVKYERTLEYWAKSNDKEYLLREFSKRNIKKPNQISRGTQDVYWWNCLICGSEYDMKVSDRTHQGSNCPYCSNQRVNHTNCMWTTHPEVASLLVNPQRGYEITAFRNKKEWFMCPECGNKQSKCVGSVTSQGLSCSKCSDGLYYPEKFMMEFLSQLEIEYETQKTFQWAKNLYHLNPKYKKLSGNKKYDFYIHSLNMIIETHGGQHYNTSFETAGGRTQEEEMENDDLKMYLAYNNGIKKYIVIDCRISDLDWIKNNILNSDLSKIFNLTNIDWLKCHEFACKSFVKKVCELWSEGIQDTLKISKIVNLSKPTVIHYLKQGAKIGWCGYDSKEEKRKRSSKAGVKNRLSVIQLSINGEFIEEWESMSQASRKLNISTTRISSCCKNKNKSAGGFVWVYREEYYNVRREK